MGVVDWPYLAIGTAGALVAGLQFPAMGWVWAYMIELLYRPVVTCQVAADLLGFKDCNAYHDDVANDMKHLSYLLTYGFIGLTVASLAGLCVTYWGFGSAAERMSKRVRDAAFVSIVRQEVAWHDLQSPGELSSQLADDTSMLQAFAGEPIRSLVISVSSVVVGLIISFVYMWPFALLILFILPFLAIGAMIEMKSYIADDANVEVPKNESSPGGIVIETLANIRTVASLTLEDHQALEYDRALEREDPCPLWSNFVKGAATPLR
ncbi:hypothetical protein MPSEU_000569500 [Mayamaea pseudoterrestris]|nr:hypothetical protein MPSEU_000569500 [Mayamaea pseudoterrestris]